MAAPYNFAYAGSGGMGSPQTFTVPTTGTFDITGYGGQGGNSGADHAAGGKGAEDGGNFSLTAGEKLKIFVGGQGGQGYTAQYAGEGDGGGGGGTFVLASTNGGPYTLLLAAGGGGGSGASSGAGGAGVITPQGNGAGGKAGAQAEGEYYAPSGGAGFKSNGDPGLGYVATHTNMTPGGTSVSSTTNPGAGGPVQGGPFNPADVNGGGGFGGGGSGYQHAGGGGGGYTGGNAGSYTRPNGSRYLASTGGSSYIASSGTAIAAQQVAGENVGNGKVEITAVCFASGTLIRTARGDIAVEALQVGDLAVTASGAHRPIRWLGHRTVSCRSHPRPHEAMPVRVAAHAFGDNRPARDLLVSPGHSLCADVVGEVLIPASAMVNGTTITQEEMEHVTYWHVELDSHDILLAENMPAESYLEMGNRCFFADGDVVALDASPDAPVATHADFCRPFHADGALVEVVRAQLAARAPRLGWRLEEQGLGDLHLMVDGVRLDPQLRGLAARFTVPPAARDVWLVSSTSVPATIWSSSDTRTLGVCLQTLAIDDGFGAALAIVMDDPRLCVGFHGVERDGESKRRWTAGRALLPASLWDGTEDEFFLRIELAFPALPRWAAPVPVASVEALPRLIA